MSLAVHTLRNGETVNDVSKGVLGRVLVGRRQERPICWTLEGRWRWDGTDHPLDIVDFKSA